MSEKDIDLLTFVEAAAAAISLQNKCGHTIVQEDYIGNRDRRSRQQFGW